MRTFSIIPIVLCAIVLVLIRPITASAEFCEPLPSPAGNVIHVERNILLDNARGVGFGLMTSGSARTYNDNPCPGTTGYVGHYNGIIRNNFIFQNRAELRDSDDSFDCGICLWQACGAKALHNSVVATAEPFSSIEWRFSNTDVEITNNLVSHWMMARDGAAASLAGNYENASLSLFLDASTGNLHLTPAATDVIDQGVFVGDGLCDKDIDGDNRDATPDVGADEIACSPDFNGDGDVDGADLAAFTANFNAACIEPFAEAFGSSPQVPIESFGDEEWK